MEAEGRESALRLLAAPGGSRGTTYSVWESEYQAKNVYSPDFLRQKLEYIHENPVQSQWQLVKSPEEYVWSSARYYLAGARCLIPVSDANDLL